jgi:hypothetical protein
MHYDLREKAMREHHHASVLIQGAHGLTVGHVRQHTSEEKSLR